MVADAVRFVSAGTGGGTGLLYVHADHLGTPQKMTDGNQAVVWDAVYKPFGDTHSIAGTASNNQRFPGQYADAETGFHQNYFRDYDPSTGRYVESDPIGLKGGDNTYLYARGNPIIFIDFTGKNPCAANNGNCEQPLRFISTSGGSACDRPQGPCDPEVQRCIAAGRAQGEEGNGNCFADIMEGAMGCQTEACVQGWLYRAIITCQGGATGTKIPSDCKNGVQNCSYRQDPIEGRPPGRFND
ncbi:MAG: hypothetical protein NPIRA05_06940 [Nitrospirales bacterium]|nr:MAG: hypothetical protein NPIRA05_06940 [Nitrospirales bacterium]